MQAKQKKAKHPETIATSTLLSSYLFTTEKNTKQPIKNKIKKIIVIIVILVE